MNVKVTSNLPTVIDLIDKYRSKMTGWWNDKTERQRFSMDVYEAGKNLLIETTAKNIDRNPRWKLSGMASKMMGGVANPVDTAWTKGIVTPDVVSWENANPIYAFLDKGTQAHGPKKAKKLFIPLNEATALAYLNGSLIYGQGVDGIYSPYAVESEQWNQKAQFGDSSFGKYKRKKIKGGATRQLVYGKDYILKDWVRGISPRNITEQFLAQMREVLSVIHNERVERSRQIAQEAMNQAKGKG